MEPKKGVGPGKKKYDPWKKKLSFPPHQPLEKKITALEKNLSTTTTTTTTTATTYFLSRDRNFCFPVSSHKKIQTASPKSCLERDQGGRLPGAISQKEILLQRHVQTSQRCSFSEDLEKPPDLFVCIRKVDGCIAHQGIQPPLCRKCPTFGGQNAPSNAKVAEVMTECSRNGRCSRTVLPVKCPNVSASQIRNIKLTRSTLLFAAKSKCNTR